MKHKSNLMTDCIILILIIKYASTSTNTTNMVESFSLVTYTDVTYALVKIQMVKLLQKEKFAIEAILVTATLD